VLAEGGRHADHPVAGVPRGGHQPSREERLIVGVCPDAQDGAELGGVGDGSIVMGDRRDPW
jgi:hypothetical protein